MSTRPFNLAAILKAAGVESQLELMLLHRLERAGLPRPETQAQIIPGRKFAFDFAYRAEKLAIEVQGGIWTNGAHARGSGVKRDCLKAALAVSLGWRVLPVDDSMIKDGQAVELIAQALGVEANRATS